jgi:rubrerythrin
MKELVETKATAFFENVLNSFGNSDSLQKDHVVICGSCGAVEQPLGPHKSECPNCDDYIY